MNPVTFFSLCHSPHTLQISSRISFLRLCQMNYHDSSSLESAESCFASLNIFLIQLSFYNFYRMVVFLWFFPLCSFSIWWFLIFGFLLHSVSNSFILLLFLIFPCFLEMSTPHHPVFFLIQSEDYTKNVDLRSLKMFLLY